MWGTGCVKRATVSAEVPGAPSRWRARLTLLLTLAAVFLVVVFLFPIIFELRIDVPSHVQFASASSMGFEISNPNLTPVTNAEYSCEVSNLILLNGSAVKDANVLNRGNFRKIGARRGVAGRCQTAYIVTAPLKTVEYKLTITYRTYPWPRMRTQTARISAQLNGKGEVTGWQRD